MLWDCTEGDARGIAGSLTACPACGKERGMPTTTTSGASNAKAEPGETGYVAPEETAASVAVAAPETPRAPAADAKVPAKAKAAQGGSEAKTAETKKR